MPETPEQRARQQIDAQLVAAGWLVQDRRRLNLHAGPGVALCETDVAGGFADYMLFVDAKSLGVLEAKAHGTPLVGVSEQSEGYAKAVTTDFQRWADPLPFTYESNGDECRFRDLRDPRSRSRFVFCVHRPETLRAWVEQKDTLRARLQKLPPLHVAGLRGCQVDASDGLDKSFARQHLRALIQMATGSGKTWMAVTVCYRYIKFGGAQRILFLVDRANLGKQAKNEFDLWHSPYTQRRFTDEYIVQRLDGMAIEPRAKVVISTIQRFYSALTGKPIDDTDDERSTYEASGDTDEPRPVAYNPALPPETFDIIIIDECHRSIYNLWKGVLDYFDAFHVGLTATPSPHTLGFFNQNLVSSYTHEQAVLDKVNVGYDIYRIRTKLTEGGATVERGNHLEKIERRTRRKRWEKLKDDYTWQGRELDRSVVSDTQVRTVINHFRDALFTKMFPHRSGDWIPKTLIYAKDDAHADRIVDIVRDVFGEGNDFCKKITYRSGGKKTAEDLIAEFRTSPQLRVTVTVDMIATGTDIKPLEIVMFLRDVRSAVYYEQMKGRGTRVIDPHELRTVTPDAKAKTHFVLVDAVGVTQSTKSASQPIERAPNVSFEKLLDKVARGNRTDQTLSSLASRLLRLDAALEPADRERVRVKCGKTPAELAHPLGESVDPDLQVAEALKGMALKETLEAIVRKLQQGKYPNEQSISMGIVIPVLGELGWDTTDPDFVWPEYSVKNGRVDFALCYPAQHPKVFVEVKQPGRADGADEQLFDYALRHGVRMALLTDGRTWSVYLPGEEGSYEDRRVYKLDLLERTSDASADSLNRYLDQARIVSGSAIDDAVREIRDRGRTMLATKTISAAWQSIVEDVDPTVTERIADEVEAKCGVRPEIDAVAKFLKQMGRGQTITPSYRPSQPNASPEPQLPPHGGEGYSYRQGWQACRTGKAVMLGLLRELLQFHPLLLEKCYQDEENRGRTRTYISQNRYEIYPTKDQAFCEEKTEELVPGWFIATNLNDGIMDNILRMACRLAGATISVDVKYSLD